jgi:flagellar hook-basal body complex protein FliE
MVDKVATFGLPREVSFPQQIRKDLTVESGKDVKRGQSFGDTLKEFVHDVDKMQKNADVQVERYATGELRDIHQVMIAAEKANLSLQLLVEIRNKMMESYREIMKMQL